MTQRHSKQSRWISGLALALQILNAGCKPKPQPVKAETAIPDPQKSQAEHWLKFTAIDLPNISFKVQVSSASYDLTSANISFLLTTDESTKFEELLNQNLEVTYDGVLLARPTLKSSIHTSLAFGMSEEKVRTLLPNVKMVGKRRSPEDGDVLEQMLIK